MTLLSLELYLDALAVQSRGSQLGPVSYRYGLSVLVRTVADRTALERLQAYCVAPMASMCVR